MTRPTITRRALLRGAGATVALTAAPMAAASMTAGSLAARPVARADGPGSPPRHLVVVMAGGGWDTTYALDPKPDSELVDTPSGAFRTRGDLRWWSAPERPNVDAFFDRWGERTCVVNGLQVRSFIHTDCMKRVLTGGPSETAPDFGAIAAYELARDLPVPYLALGSFARSGPFAALTGRSGTTNQLSALVDPAASYRDLEGRLETGLLPTAGEATAVRRFLEASAARVQATRGSTGYNRRRVQDFVDSLDRAERLVLFGQESGLGQRDFTQALNVQVPLAVRALRDGLSHVAFLQMDGWDTHVANAAQTPQHEALFGTVDTLAAALEAEGLLDSTVVAVLSEMGRTPRLNGEMGKDHWPVTSALVLGAGVGGGRVLGATDDQLDAASIDLSTGAIDPGGAQLQTSNFIAGLLAGVGVDPVPHLPGSEPFLAYCA